MRSTTPVAPAVYVRWSTEEQGSGTTLEEQRQTCLGFLADRGWPVREDLIYIDDGYSAGSLDRPAMQRLRAAVRRGDVDAVVVYKLDRLTRNIVDAVELVLKEWEGRCALVSVTQSSIDTTNALGRQFFTLMASFAEFEREMIRDRTMSGKKRRAMQGRNPGFRPPFGYRTGETPGSIVVDEERAPFVVQIFEMYASGLSHLEIARRLNRLGVPNPGDGRGWQNQTVRYMLQNPMYIGRLEYGRTSRKGQVPHYAVVQNAVQPIVPVKLWQAVQALLSHRSRETGFSNRAASSSFLLTGLARCTCGTPLSGVESRGVAYYRCKDPQGVCTATLIRTEILDDLVLAAIREQFQGQLGEGILRAAAARVDASRDSLEATVANLKGALAEIGRKKDRARKDYFAGDLTGRMYTEFMAQLEEHEGATRHSLREAELQLVNPVVKGPDVVWLLSNIDQGMSDTWAGLGMAEKKQMLRVLVPQYTAFRAKGTAWVEMDLSVVSADAHQSYVREYLAAQ